MNTNNILLNQPPLSQNEEIKDNIVTASNDIVKSIVDYLAKENINKTAQPNLIIGENGSGKTFLLKKLYTHIAENELRLHPIFIEGKKLFSTDDIWRHCMPSQEKSHRIVLLIDNIQYYFTRTCNEEQYKLREKLNKAGAPILVATADKVLPALTNYNAAFFEGFKISYIKPLTESDFKTLLPQKTDMARFEILMSYMPKTPRSLLIATRILKMSDSSATDINFLVDYFSIYYLAKYNGYVTQIQRILSAIANAENGVSLQDIRKTINQDNGKISPYLKIMVDQKILNKLSKTQRGGIYYISDPLFKLWLQKMI